MNIIGFEVGEDEDLVAIKIEDEGLAFSSGFLASETGARQAIYAIRVLGGQLGWDTSDEAILRHIP